MSRPIEDYAVIGDTHTAALVSTEGSIDWLCVPRFDSGACFAAILGDERHGRWKIAPAGPVTAVRRRYRGDGLVLETEFDTAEGTVRLIDCMPPREKVPQVVRMVEGVRGSVPMRMELIIRFDYGQTVPWVRRVGGALHAIAGPDALNFWSPVRARGRDLTHTADFTVGAGQDVPFILAWYPSHEEAPRPLAARYVVEETEEWWESWAHQCTYEGPWRDLVMRSLATLKALTYAPTGGIVAAATTSLPETLGGERNWDYRYCWLRDATFTLMSLMGAGYHDEAMCWRDWLLRAVAGDPKEIQIMYGPAGERRLDERELQWLPGYEGSRPVRVGNAAAGQFQLDVYGEVLDALHQARSVGIADSSSAWDLQRALLDFLESGWSQPDEGIWEVRGPRRQFTHSKVMAWVAMDRAVQGVERSGLEGPVDRWRAVRQQIHDEVLSEAWNPDLGAFTQYYGSDQLDASLLLIPLVGFLPADDPRVKGTVAAIEKNLVSDGLVLRYRTSDDGAVDGLTGREGTFLACSFWLADNYTLMGRRDEARRLFERLAGLANDVGLLAEEYDPVAGRMVGNFPQAFSHVSLVNSARNLVGADGPARDRRHGTGAGTAHVGRLAVRRGGRGLTRAGRPDARRTPTR
ncbi:MAG TPA: glycoside hydrolase family 15 protein [Acidimicrobiales bacterium]|nr:glycoside hydrolase family 15 protein [Acidimicrobiales bacterium]